MSQNKATLTHIHVPMWKVSEGSLLHDLDVLVFVLVAVAVAVVWHNTQFHTSFVVFEDHSLFVIA